MPKTLEQEAVPKLVEADQAQSESTQANAVGAPSTPENKTSVAAPAEAPVEGEYKDVDVPEGLIPGTDSFNTWTYENWHTQAGTAQITVRDILGRLEENQRFSSYVFSKGKDPNRDNIDKCEDKITLANLKKFTENLLVISNAWLSERKDDKKRSNRKRGFERFVSVLLNVQKTIDQRLAVPEIETSKGEALDEKTEKMASDIDKKSESAKVHYENRSASSVFQNLEKPLKSLAPSANSSGSLEVSVKIPVVTVPGMYLGGSMKVEGENEGGDGFSVKTDANFLVGFEGNIPFIAKGEVGFSVGGYIESKGKTAKDALTLISYGFYRRVRESAIGRHADALWGGATTAEKFVERTETDLLSGEDNENYVELGGQAGIDAEAKLGPGVVGLTLGAKAKSGKRYDKETTGKDAAGELKKGKSSAFVGVSGGFSVGIADWEVAVGLESGTQYLKDPNPSVAGAAGNQQVSSTTSFEISAKTPELPLNASLKVKLIKLFLALSTKMNNVSAQTNADAGLSWQAANEGLMQAIESSSEEGLFGEATEDSFGDLEQGAKSSSKLGLSLKFEIEQNEDEKKSTGSGALSSINETEIAITLPTGGVNIKAEKSSNLLKIEKASGEGWSWTIG